ncbi:hypothetical protein AJ88_16135 [Mesorhizobium amorphae CCBAU 01583]|nr:hypothetical protein AJ88_16135 [Mesorhizobium amorphae CCBAU 01583]
MMTMNQPCTARNSSWYRRNHSLGGESIAAFGAWLSGLSDIWPLTPGKEKAAAFSLLLLLQPRVFVMVDVGRRRRDGGGGSAAMARRVEC